MKLGENGCNAPTTMCGQTGRPVDQGLEPCVRRWRYADCARLAQVV